MQAHILQARFRTNLPPEPLEPHPWRALASGGKDPLWRSRQTVEDMPRRGAEPDCARSSFAIGQVKSSLPVETPFEGQDFRLAASGQEKQPDHRRMLWTFRLVTLQNLGEAAVLFRRQEPLGSRLTVAADTLAGIAVLWAMPPSFPLLHDDGQDRRRAVRRRGRCVEGAKPGLHILMGYRSDAAPFEEREDLPAEVDTVTERVRGFQRRP